MSPQSTRSADDRDNSSASALSFRSEIGWKGHLGAGRWREEDLRAAYFGDFENTRQLIRTHPGYRGHRDLEALGISLEIFTDAVSDLEDCIDAFHCDSLDDRFWHRPAQPRFDRRVRAVRRAVFGCTTSAVAWLEHVKQTSGRRKPEQYSDRMKSFTENPCHRFIVLLRNCLSHIGVIPPDWQISLTFDQAVTEESQREHVTRFLLSKTALMDHKWKDAVVKQFLKDHNFVLDTRVLFATYRDFVSDFHRWFVVAMAQELEPALSEYRHYEALLKRWGAKNGWAIRLSHLKPGTDIVSEFCDDLTPEQLAELQTFPIASTALVDRVLDMVDEHGACDDEIRRIAHGRFVH